MVRSRRIGALTVLGLVAALGTVAPSSATAAQSQTITFTNSVQSGADWYRGDSILGFEYSAEAEASSGLQVVYSIAPESAGVCSISTHPLFPSDGTWAPISFDHAGTCTIWADQPGDADYLPAPRATQTFQIEKVPTWIDQVKAKRGLPGHAARFSARLKTWRFVSSMWIGVEPFDGEPVTFSVAGRPVCTGTTGADGIATCQGPLLRSELSRLRFTATYAGTNDYKSVSGSAFFILG
ncbi:hypothetical protein [Nocardioides sp. MH1]|uniref:hypothetical protein n=1 Tax=Nocardioides sp. MH1 TaxID=3242490 RepID=UPI003522F504